MNNRIESSLESLVGFLVGFKDASSFDKLVASANAELSISLKSEQSLRHTRLQIKYILYCADSFDLPHLSPFWHLAKQPISQERRALILRLLTAAISAKSDLSKVDDGHSTQVKEQLGAAGGGSKGFKRRDYESLSEYERKPYTVAIDDLDLSVRSKNGLKASGVEFVGDIVAEDWSRTLEKMAYVEGIGNKSLKEIRACVENELAGLPPVRGWTRPDKSAGPNRNLGLLESEVVQLKNYKTLLPKDQKPYMVSVESLDVSVRSLNRLALLGIEYVGDIVAENKVWTDGVIRSTPGVGVKAFDEIRRFIDYYQTELDPIRGWTRPKNKSESSLDLVETPVGATLQDELAFALELVSEPHKRDLVAARFGIGKFESRHTLRELGDGRFWPDGESRTRERARQVISQVLQKIRATNISFSTWKSVEAIVKKKPFWSQRELGRELNAVSIEAPKQLFRSLIALQTFSSNQSFVIREGVAPILFDSKKSESQFDADKASIRSLYTDKLFLPVSEIRKIPSFADIDLEEWSELGVPSIVCKSVDDIEFVARKVTRLKSHASYPDTMIAKIFSLTSQVRLELLIEAVLSSSRRKPNSIPNNDRTLLKNYLLQLPYLTTEDGLVKNVQRPSLSYLNDTDLAIISCATEYGVEINTDELHRWLLRELDCTELSARQKAMFSPLLVTLSKGRGGKPGVKRLVCDLSDIDQLQGEHAKPLASFKFTVRNSIRLKHTGEVNLEEKIADGRYPIVLSEDPDIDIGWLTIREGRAHDLQDIANAYDTDRFTFTYDSAQGVFYMQK